MLLFVKSIYQYKSTYDLLCIKFDSTIQVHEPYALKTVKLENIYD